jgi:hypothetical protein
MTGIRLGVGGLGFAAAAYGIVRLLELGVDNLVAAAAWLVGGVVVHDGLLAPLTVGVGVLLVRSRHLPGAAVTGLVVLGTVTVLAVPVLGRFGARPDNPTLLDRNYVLGWLALATLTVLYVGIAALAPRLRSKGGGHGAGAGRR